MKPVNGIANTTNPFSCGNPGAVDGEQLTSVGACSWNFEPNHNEFYWVTEGGDACEEDSDCSSGICGLSFNPGHSELL